MDDNNIPEQNVGEIIEIKNEYYIKATSALADRRTHVLKEGELFAIFDRFGDFHPLNLGEQGLYYGNTRFLNRFEVRLFSKRLLLLGSVVRKDNAVLTIDLTNPDIANDGTILFEKDTIHIFRTAFLWNNSCYQKFHIHNYHHLPLSCNISFSYSADFADMFEVRGLKRDAKGTLLEPEINKSSMVFYYLGLDQLRRRTQLHFSMTPDNITNNSASFTLDIKAHETKELTVTFSYEESKTDFKDHSVQFISIDDAYNQMLEHKRHHKDEEEIITSNDLFNEWLKVSAIDLQLMNTRFDGGEYPYAGIPWFSAPFGRDGIITALETLWYDPNVARNVLRFLAKTQATTLDPTADAEPGKIIHEMRLGEMAALKEVPFGKYYGSIDSTPLFLILTEAYYRRTNDLDLIKQIWPSIELALNWLQKYGDVDGDGFIEYAPHAKKGLIHQGWKDSHDSVFHADGRPAIGPIALCEVQAYAYGAYRAGASLAHALGDQFKADEYSRHAKELKIAFNQRFWSEDLQTFGLALDGSKELCRVISSNAGQCLLTGIVDEDKAKKLVKTLFSNEMFSGWGIRTVSIKEPLYNPMSYHNGSIWPHDNALVAMGLKNYGFHKECLLLLSTFFDASAYLNLHRMPELFCGFERRADEGPTPYPVACAPQAWSACSVFAFLQAAIGLELKGGDKQIVLSQPNLPLFLTKLELRNIKIGDASCDLSFFRHNDKTAVSILRKTTDMSIIIEQ